MEDAKMVRRHLRNLEKNAGLVEEFRGLAKTEGGRLTPFGRGVLASAKSNGVKQAIVARLFDISAGAVSQHYNK